MKKPWFFILIGVLMTVLSAVITNYFVVENNKSIEKSELKAARLEKKIDQTWEASKDLERLEETGTMLLLISDLADTNKKKIHAKQAARRYFDKVLLTGAVDPNTAKKIKADIESGMLAEVLDKLFSVVDKQKSETVDTINDLYIEKAAIERMKIGVEERNSVLANIALFLHIMGLILVLSTGMLKPEDKATF